MAPEQKIGKQAAVAGAGETLEVDYTSCRLAVAELWQVEWLNYAGSLTEPSKTQIEVKIGCELLDTAAAAAAAAVVVVVLQVLSLHSIADIHNLCRSGCACAKSYKETRQSA